MSEDVRSILLRGCKAVRTTEVFVQQNSLVEVLGKEKTAILVSLGKPSNLTEKHRPLRPVAMLTIDRLMLIEALEGTMPELQDVSPVTPQTEEILGVDEVE